MCVCVCVYLLLSCVCIFISKVCVYLSFGKVCISISNVCVYVYSYFLCECVLFTDYLYVCRSIFVTATRAGDPDEVLILEDGAVLVSAMETRGVKPVGIEYYAVGKSNRDFEPAVGDMLDGGNNRVSPALGGFSLLGNSVCLAGRALFRMMFSQKKVGDGMDVRFIVMRANRDITRADFLDAERALLLAGYLSPFDSDNRIRLALEVFYGRHTNSKIPWGPSGRYMPCACFTMRDHADINWCVPVV